MCQKPTGNARPALSTSTERTGYCGQSRAEPGGSVRLCRSICTTVRVAQNAPAAARAPICRIGPTVSSYPSAPSLSSVAPSAMWMSPGTALSEAPVRTVGATVFRTRARSPANVWASAVRAGAKVLSTTIRPVAVHWKPCPVPAVHCCRAGKVAGGVVVELAAIPLSCSVVVTKSSVQQCTKLLPSRWAF